jgi:hypothetical protein
MRMVSADFKSAKVGGLSVFAGETGWVAITPCNRLTGFRQNIASS